MGETRVIEFGIAGGLNQKQAQEYLDPNANMATIINGNFTRVGAVDKRLGLQHLPNTLLPGSTLPQMTSAVRVAGWSRSALTVASTQGLYGFSAAENGAVGIGALPPPYPIRRPITTTPQTAYPILCDVPYLLTTLRVSVYQGTNYGIYCTVSDADSGDVILAPTLLYAATGTPPQNPYPLQAMYLENAAPGYQCVIAWYDNNTGHAYACHYVPSTNNFDTTTDLGPVGPVDMVPFLGDPAGGLIAFVTSSTTTVRWIYLAANFSPINSGVVENVSAIGALNPLVPVYCYATYGEAIWFAYQVYNTAITTWYQRVAAIQGGGSFGQVYAPATLYQSVGIAAFSACTGIVRLTPTTAYVGYWNAVNPNPGTSWNAPQGVWFTLDTAGTVPVLTIGQTPLGYLPIARPFLQGTTLYQACALCMMFQSSEEPSALHSEQGTVYLMQFNPRGATTAWGGPVPGIFVSTGGVQYTQTTWFPVATIAPRQVDLTFTNNFPLEQGFTTASAKVPFMSAVSAQGTATRLANAFKTIGSSIAGVSGARGSAWAADFYFDATSQGNLYQCNELGTALHISGGTPFLADGASTFEDSFFYYPEFAYCTQGGSGGTLTGTYAYAVVYTYLDAAGLLHRGSPVFPTPILISGSQKVTLFFPPYSSTWRDIANPGQVYAEIYRTVSNGDVFYLVERVACSNTTASILQWPASGGDTVADATIEVATILYTTGGTLDNVNPPAAPIQLTHLSRVVIVDETLQQTWESAQFVPGSAPGFNEVLITPYSEGGDITALASMDDKLLVFKASSIWVRYGEGPAPTGQGSDWTIPQKIASDVGALNWQSVVLTPMGVMFQAQAGIYMIDRGLSVSFIGRPVVGLLATYPTIVGSVLVPSANHVRFLAQNEEGEQITIVYDYLLQQWTQHVYGQVGAAPVSVTLPSSGQMALVCADGELYQEHLPSDVTAYEDDSFNGAPSFVPTTITWPWVKTSVQGYQRIRQVMFLGEQLNSCGLEMGLAYDYVTEPVEVTSWSSERLAEYNASVMRVERHVGALYNKQQAIQVTIQDTPGTGPDGSFTGQGCRFVSISIELDQIGERYRRLPVGLRT